MISALVNRLRYGSMEPAIIIGATGTITVHGMTARAAVRVIRELRLVPPNQGIPQAVIGPSDLVRFVRPDQVGRAMLIQSTDNWLAEPKQWGTFNGINLED